jgi:hypothetical protein
MQEPYDIEIGDKLRKKLEKLQSKDTNTITLLLTRYFR